MGAAYTANMTSETVVIEAVEQDLARLELPDGREVVIPVAWLPAEAIEGHHLLVEFEAGQVNFRVDLEATEVARKRNQELLDKLNKGYTGGELKI